MSAALKLLLAAVAGIVGAAVAYMPTVLLACFTLWPERDWCMLPALLGFAPAGAILGGWAGWRLAAWIVAD